MFPSSRNVAKAYLLGVYLGDGCVASRRRLCDNKRFQFILVGVDLDIHNRTRLCIERLFPEKQGRIRICHERNTNAGTPYYRMDVTDEGLSSLLLNLTGESKNHFPKEGWLYKPSIFPEFVAGLMDTDGCIEQSFQPRQLKTPRWGLSFCNVSPWVFDLRKLLIRCGVEVSGLKAAPLRKYTMSNQNQENWNTLYRMTMKVQSFVNAGMYFRIWRKRCRMHLRNWWCTRSPQGRQPVGQAQALLAPFEVEKKRIAEKLSYHLNVLESKLTQEGVLYRRAVNPQRPEAHPSLPMIEVR